MGKLGVIGALDEEISGVIAGLSNARESNLAGRTYRSGLIGSTPVVAVAARIGKVAAAMTTAALILRHEVTHVLVVGVAGAATPRVNRGDVVIARRLVQHDMDAAPLFPALEVPLTGRAAFDADQAMTARLMAAAQSYIAEQLDSDFSEAVQTRFGLGDGPSVIAGVARRPRAIRADVMTGDRFIADHGELDDIATLTTQRGEAVGVELDLAAVEMESAAIAQVCQEHGVPFAALRIISDSADDDAVQDFSAFLREIAGPYSAGIVKRFVEGGTAPPAR